MIASPLLRGDTEEHLFTFLSLALTHMSVDVQNTIFGSVHLHDLHVKGALFMQGKHALGRTVGWYVRMPYYLFWTLFCKLGRFRSDALGREPWKVPELLMWHTPAMHVYALL